MLQKILEAIISTSFVVSLVRVATPLVLASLGAVVTSNAGITNIGIEGVMLTSALAGVFASAFGFGPWFGLLIAILTGVLCSLAIGYMAMSLKVNSVLACIAFNTMAIGGTVYFMYAVVKDKGTTLSLESGKLPTLNILQGSEVSVLEELFLGHNVVSYFAFLMIIIISVLLYKTPLGMRIRSAGKAPHALSSVGVDLVKIRYLALMISGILGGMAGAFMSMGYVTWFSKNMTAGRGFIALAADAMGNSHPIGAVISALFFASAETLSYTLQITNISPELVQMVPYLSTIIGLSIYAAKKESQKRKFKISELGN